METGDGYNEESGGLAAHEENVIRLPRDWLGPPEELVPIGPAARARAAQRDRDGGMPPAADAFWSEDSAALHDAVQAPPAEARARFAPPAGLVPPVAGLRRGVSSHLPRLRALRVFSRLSWRAAVLTGVVAALATAAVVGISEGPASHRIDRHTPASRLTSSSDLAASTNAGTGDKTVASRSARVATGRHPGSHARTRAHARRTRVVKTHHRAVPRHSTRSASPTVTEASASSPATHSSVSSVTTTPTASTASTVASTGSKPAAGPAGPTGFGQMTGGCSPKCK